MLVKGGSQGHRFCERMSNSDFASSIVLVVLPRFAWIVTEVDR